MDSYYEECAVNQKAKRGEKIYKIVNVAFWLFVVLSIIDAMFVLEHIPWETPTAENFENYEYVLSLFLFFLFWFILFVLAAVLIWFIKRRINVSFDYLFVTGELRITKVFNVNKRKLVTRIDSENVLKVGDVDSASYDRIKGDPSTKEVICTPNVTAAEGKFFMYVQVVENGLKKLYVLECREMMLVNMLQYLRRDILADDYVSQAKKNEV